jgi:putative oxidoreductase
MKFFTAQPLWQNGGILLARLITGIFMIIHGWEVFDPIKMQEYAQWEQFKSFSSPSFMVYLGKAAELVGGVMLALGFLTRIASLILAITMAYIAFFVGHGIVWYDDQHPFLFVVLALTFFVTGGGKYSMDALIFKEKKRISYV